MPYNEFISAVTAFIYLKIECELIKTNIMNEKLRKNWDYIVSECIGMRSRSINVGGHLRRAAIIAAAEELERNEEFCRWLPMSGWYYGELTGAWHKDHDESNTRYKFEDVVNAWKAEKLRNEATE